MDIDESSKIIKDFMADLSSEYTSADTPYQLYAALDFLTHEAHMMQIVRSLPQGLEIYHDVSNDDGREAIQGNWSIRNCREQVLAKGDTLDECLTKWWEVQK